MSTAALGAPPHDHRRIRNYQCPHLHLEPESAAILDAARYRDNPPAYAEGWCAVRRTTLTGDFISDVCTCSLAKQCVFLEGSTPSPATRAPSSKPVAPAPRLYFCTKCEQGLDESRFKWRVRTKGRVRSERCLACMAPEITMVRAVSPEVREAIIKGGPARFLMRTYGVTQHVISTIRAEARRERAA